MLVLCWEDMDIGFKDKDQAELLRFAKKTALQFLYLPPIMLVGFAVLFGALGLLFGESFVDVAMSLVRATAFPLAVVQLQMLVAVLAFGAVCYFLGRDQIKAQAHYLAALIGSNIPGLKLLQSAIWGHSFTLVCQPNAPILRSIRLTVPVSTAPRHVSGLSPQLE